MSNRKKRGIGRGFVEGSVCYLLGFSDWQKIFIGA